MGSLSPSTRNTSKRWLVWAASSQGCTKGLCKSKEIWFISFFPLLTDVCHCTWTWASFESGWGTCAGKVCTGDCSTFHSLEEHVDQVGLGQTGVVWLLNRVNCCGTDSLLGLFNVSQTVRLKNAQNMKLFYYYFLRHFENTCEWSLLKGSPQNCFSLSTHKSQTCDF